MTDSRDLSAPSTWQIDRPLQDLPRHTHYLLQQGSINTTFIGCIFTYLSPTFLVSLLFVPDTIDWLAQPYIGPIRGPLP